jgi:hypothetical protein
MPYQSGVKKKEEEEKKKKKTSGSNPGQNAAELNAQSKFRTIKKGTVKNYKGSRFKWNGKRWIEEMGAWKDLGRGIKKKITDPAKKKNNKAERLNANRTAHERRKKKRTVEATPNTNAAFKNKVADKVKINKGENQTNNNTTTSKEAPIRKVEKTAAEKHNEGIKKAQKNLPEQKEVVAKELEGKIRRMGMSGKRGILGIKKRKAMEAEIKRLRKKKPDEERNKQGAH